MLLECSKINRRENGPYTRALDNGEDNPIIIFNRCQIDRRLLECAVHAVSFLLLFLVDDELTQCDFETLPKLSRRSSLRVNKNRRNSFLVSKALFLVLVFFTKTFFTLRIPLQV